MRRLVWAGIIFSLIGFSTQAAQVSPTPVYQVDDSGILGASAVIVFQDGSSSAGYRSDCFVQNKGMNPMYYSFTGTATTSSKVLASGASFTCSSGTTVDSQALSLIGTSGDSYSATESFIRGQ